MGTSINWDKKYLGILCKRGHDWEGTGKSLRYRISKGCISCRCIHNILNEGKRNLETRRKYVKSSEYHESDRNRSKKDREKLTDRYIKVQLKISILKFKNVPQSLVELKRAQLKLYRLIREVSHG